MSPKQRYNMNPFHSIDELYFSSANYSLPIQTTTPLTLDQISPDPVMDVSDLPCAKDHKSSNIHEIKKWMHRESEKQRRQEISKLCATFRSHLPLAYIKVIKHHRHISIFILSLDFQLSRLIE